MNWKQFKKLFQKEPYDESQFILGIDLGNDTTVLSYFDVHNKAPEVIDLSGGYGKPSVPTVMQYVPETKEWVFGEYAVLNMGLGRDVTFVSLVERLGRKEYVDVDRKSVSIVQVLGLYLKELIGNVKNLNPKASVVGIVVAVPSYFSEEASDELTQAFKNAGYEKELIGLYSDRACLFGRLYFERKAQREKVLILDFGSREMRGGVYDVAPEPEDVNMTCIASFFDETMGTKVINDTVLKLFTHFYCKSTGTPPDRLAPQAKKQLDVFVYQHKDLLFQKNSSLKPIRLYYNFAYPPFQQNMTKAEIETFVSPFAKSLRDFVSRLLEKNVYAGGGAISPHDIDQVILIGGGFEMEWAKRLVADLFPDSNIAAYKNAKAVISEGAAVLAAAELAVIEGSNARPVRISDRNQLQADTGVFVTAEKKTRFIPIIEKNKFWWQKHPARLFLINEKTDKPVSLQIFRRDAGGEAKQLSEVVLDGLPERPRGTTRLKLNLQYTDFQTLKLDVTDMGFGELFPKAEGYSREFVIHDGPN